jgi:secondary thiamine-phosphate synthase enzyme
MPCIWAGTLPTPGAPETSANGVVTGRDGRIRRTEPGQVARLFVLDAALRRCTGPQLFFEAMAVHTGELRLSTQGDSDVIDITDGVQRVVATAGASEAQATAFVRGSTAAITTMEFEAGGVHDLRQMLERLVPTQGDYEHNRLNNDTNSHAHQRASLIGAAETVPVADGRLALGTWQQLVLIDFDDRPRQRTVVVQVVS